MITVNEIWTSHNFLSKTRIILTTGLEFSAIPHPTPWNTHTTHLLVTLHSSAPTCFSLGEASCSWKQHILWSLSCRQDTPALSEKHYGLLRREDTYQWVQWEKLELNVFSAHKGMCCLFPSLTFLFAAFALELR